MDAAKLTTKSQEALSEAVRRAAGSGHPAVEPVHVLLSLLGQPDGTAGHLLDAAGVDRAAVRARAEEALRRLPIASGSTVASPQLSRPSYSVLQTAGSTPLPPYADRRGSRHPTPRARTRRWRSTAST